ncbi:MAG: nucleotidyl transferase AbiEii/AbiGii toxin family protein [Bacteroidales bacterium]|nr:nucleotidyl transferase AbiEii/AbiGii toxin family protein [Bacteroidales bacterium]
MYSKADIDLLASKSGFIRDNLEKVLRLCEILQFITDNPLTAGNLALKGGTAINLVVFDLPRLSVDIDLDFTKNCSKEEMLEARKRINTDIINYMNTQGYNLSPSTKNPHTLDSWVFYYRNVAGNKDNIKIEINYSMRNHVLPIIFHNVKLEDIPISVSVRVLSPVELFASKIKALIERTAPRDLFDVYNMIENNVIQENDYPLLRKIVLFYLAVGGNKLPTEEYNLDTIESMNYFQIKRKLIPVLKKGDQFNFEKAKVEVKAFIASLMILNEEEREFVKKFRNKIYEPNFLFEDKEITERIINHPMAIWKCTPR